MPFDPERIIQAALQAALEEPAPPARGRRPLLSAGRALLLGAGAVTAARLAVRLRGGKLVDALEHRLLEYEERTSSHDEETAAEEQEEELSEAGDR